MSFDVISAEYKGEYRISLAFENGRTGEVDFRRFVERGGVFDRLKDSEYFKRFSINRELGVLTWDNGIDIAPEVLYSEATGEPLPDWMSSPA